MYGAHGHRSTAAFDLPLLLISERLEQQVDRIRQVLMPPSFEGVIPNPLPQLGGRRVEVYDAAGQYQLAAIERPEVVVGR